MHRIEEAGKSATSSLTCIQSWKDATRHCYPLWKDESKKVSLRSSSSSSRTFVILWNLLYVKIDTICSQKQLHVTSYGKLEKKSDVYLNQNLFWFL